MSTLSAIQIPRSRLASAIAALVVATLAAIAMFAVLEDDSGPARSGASATNERSADLGTRTGSADALERQAELDRRSGHASPDAIDRPVAGNGSVGTAGSPDAIDRVKPSTSNRHGSADAAEQWLDK